MPAFLVTLNTNVGGRSQIDDADAQIIFAADSTQAEEMAAAKYDSDGQAWSANVTATEIVAANDWNGWSFEVGVYGGLGAGGTDPGSVKIVGDATNNSVDLIAAELVTALNGLSGIAAASYDSSTNILTVAGASDNIGDQKVFVNITPPGGYSPIPSLVGTIVDQGTAAAALTVTLPADATAVPATIAAAKQV